MESPDPFPDGLLPSPRSRPAPTAQDIENARIRQEIAARQEAEWVACFQWALAAFGPGWNPSHRHFLLDKQDEDDARRTGTKPTPAATVYTVKHQDGRRRHFTVENGQVIEHASYQDGFGDMLREPHPTQTIEVRGQTVHPHRYSLCWAGYELYHPKSAEELAKRRASREQKKHERLDREWKENNPLWAYLGYKRGDEF